VAIMYDQTGKTVSEKSEMVASELDLLKSQLVHKMTTESLNLQYL